MSDRTYGNYLRVWADEHDNASEVRFKNGIVAQQMPREEWEQKYAYYQQLHNRSTRTFNNPLVPYEREEYDRLEYELMLVYM